MVMQLKVILLTETASPFLKKFFGDAARPQSLEAGAHWSEPP